METPSNFHKKKEDPNLDWSKIGEIINIRDRLRAMRDLKNVLQR